MPATAAGGLANGPGGMLPNGGCWPTDGPPKGRGACMVATEGGCIDWPTGGGGIVLGRACGYPGALTGWAPG